MYVKGKKMSESRLITGDYQKSAEPLISILIPAFRKSEYLFQAIDSAVSQEPCVDYEVIVVSNDPSCDLSELTEKYKNNPRFFLYQNDTNIGMVRNSNRCAELARGKYIAFLHDDDYLLDNYLPTISRFITEQKDIKCLITGRWVRFEGQPMKAEIIKKYLRRIYCIPDLYRKNYKTITLNDCLKSGMNIYCSPSCGTVISREAFVSLGGFDERIEYSFDLDFFLRLNSCYDIAETTTVCAVYRMGDNASLKPSVKYDFYSYYRDVYFTIMSQNKTDELYIKKNKDAFLYTVYKQLGPELEKEMKKRDESITSVSRMKLKLYRIKTALYFYNHNLDIQRY